MNITTADHERVTRAVAQAEAGTSGEIVTVVTRRSDEYHDVGLHYAVLAMLGVPALLAVFPGIIERWLDNGWTGEFDTAHVVFWVMIVQAVVFLLVRYGLAWMPLRLALTPAATKARRVRRRAIAAFKVGAERRTTGHTGILIYLSLDEHRAEIVADAAIHAVTTPEAWGAAMAALIDEVRAGRVGDGMVAAVTAVGAILSEHLPRDRTDANELPDRMIEL